VYFVFFVTFFHSLDLYFDWGDLAIDFKLFFEHFLVDWLVNEFHLKVVFVFSLNIVVFAHFQLEFACAFTFLFKFRHLQFLIFDHHFICLFNTFLSIISFFKAYEAEPPRYVFVILLDLDGCDFSPLCEEFSDFIVIPSGREVLHIQVVKWYFFAFILFFVLTFYKQFFTFVLVAVEQLNCLVDFSFFLETDKAESLRVLFWIQWYFCRKDCACSCKLRWQFFTRDIFRKILDNYVEFWNEFRIFDLPHEPKFFAI